jgi:EmrB/QacA subfamily drug resistance transporter
LSRGQFRTLIVCYLAVAVVIAAMAALYAGLPQIAVATGATQTQLTWVIDGYTLALACLVLPAGAIGDRLGRRNALVFGLLVFALASAMPLIWRDPNLLIVSRTLTGVGAAFVMPSTLSILTAGLPEKRRGRAIGIWAGVAGAGGVVGIFGSGLLLEKWSWLSIFIALTIAAAILAALALTLPESRETNPSPLDPAGAVAAALCISGLVFAIIESSDRGWRDPVVLAALSVSITAGVTFGFVEHRARHPMLDLAYFAKPGFASGALSLTIQFVATFGVFVMLVQYVQLVLGFGTVQTALGLAPVAVPLMLFSAVTPWLASRLGLRLMSVLGLGTVGAGLWWFSTLHLGSSYASSVLPMMTFSLGMSLCAAPATTAIMQDTPTEKHGVAAAVNDTAREVGAAIGIAVGGSVLAAAYSSHIHPALSHLPAAARRPVSESLAAALQVADRAGPAGKPLADFAKDGFMHGLDRAAVVLSIISLVGALVIGLLAPGRSTRVSLSKAPRLRSRLAAKVRFVQGTGLLRRLAMRGSSPPTPS